MARLVTDGAEMQDVGFISGATFANPVISNATPYLSDWYYQIQNTRGMWRNLPAAISECYVRARVRAAGLEISHRFLELRLSTTVVAIVSINALNQWIATVTTVGLVGTSVPVMVGATWYCLEVYYLEANAPNGRFVVRIDGTTVIDYTGDTQPAAATTFDNINFTAGSGTNLLVDDIAVNDTAGGAPDNTWVGDGIISKIYPDGDGTHSNWHGSDGDDVNNYALCDEFPRDDDVTYNYHDGASAGTQQQFALSDWSGAGKSILRIYAEARARKTTADGAHTIKLGQLAAGGADVVSAGRTLYTGAYTRVVGNDALVNPVTGIAWVEADLDALEFVAEIG
jgi:hypothetical protein